MLSCSHPYLLEEDKDLGGFWFQHGHNSEHRRFFPLVDGSGYALIDIIGILGWVEEIHDYEKTTLTVGKHSSNPE